MGFLDDIMKEQTYTLTENDALALDRTGSNLVDLFAVAGALRYREDQDIKRMFAKAMTEDRLLATRLAFYTRDVRGGLGERRTGRLMFEYLTEYFPEIFEKNAELISEYGRWDDLVYLMEKAPEVIVPIIERQLNDDLKNMAEGKPISLLAKWLPSVNTSSAETVRKARLLAKCLKMSDKDYRKTLSALRKYLNVVEVNMSASDYARIVYSEVPSKAMNNYRNAFDRNDKERFEEYLEKVKSGEEKINASVLYPYDVVEKYLYGNEKNNDVLEAQWKALPDYVEGDNKFLIMADVSGSMWGRPMATSIGLAMYFAERNKGTFANRFMTFSAKPELVEIKGSTLSEKINFIKSSAWEMNTDLEAAFDLVLYTAIKHNTPQDELPDSIIIISDMEIDQCSEPDKLFCDQISERFAKAGYKMPKLVFWNVNSRQNTYHSTSDVKGVQLASGQSPSVFKSLVEGVDLTPYDFMLTVLDSPRYEAVTV